MDYKNIFKVIISPQSILIVSLLILFVGRYIFKIRYINCFDLLAEHIKCFRNAKGKISYLTIALYFGIPLLIAIALVKIKCIDNDSINIITIIISILTSMFFTLLTLTIDMRHKIKENINYDANRAVISKKLLKETYYSIMFEILISIIVLIFCFLNMFTAKFTHLGSLIIYYLTFIILFNLFMILKRTFKIIQNDMND